MYHLHNNTNNCVNVQIYTQKNKYLTVKFLLMEKKISEFGVWINDLKPSKQLWVKELLLEEGNIKDYTIRDYKTGRVNVANNLAPILKWIIIEEIPSAKAILFP